ncbi:hypothetical protein GCM10010300_49140 [Streptomyces olivaceoviridis]|nr:hypothetical protein GCM10010300_49140 [Streptomyces olivaceoviridis]
MPEVFRTTSCAGVETVEVEDVAGGGRVAEPVVDVLDPVGGGRDRGAVRAGGQMQVTERDQTDRMQGSLLPGAKGWNGGAPRPAGKGRARRSRGATGWRCR